MKRSYSSIYATDQSLLAGKLYGKPELAVLGPYLSCLKTLGFEHSAVLEGFCDGSKGTADWVEELFNLQLSLAKQACGGKKAIGLLIHEYSGPMFNQMQTAWADLLRYDERYQLFVVMSDIHLTPPDRFLDTAFSGYPWIWAPPGEKLVRLDFLDAVIALDYAAEKMRRLPPNTLRILQPHGTDILARYGYMFYGAGLMFDYLLCPSFEPDILAPNFEELLIDLFPREIIDHRSETLTLVPFGNTKIDSFISRMSDTQPVDIIYNFSYWKLESDKARSNAIRTVESLLESFPGRRLIFRPFPGDEACHRELIERFSSNPQFVLSLGPSYIEDYRNGALLIHHRGSSSEVFAMATLQPAIRFDEQDAAPMPQETEIGYTVFSLRQLLELVSKILASPDACCERLLERRNRKYPAAGRSLPLFLDHLYILLEEGKRQPAWRMIPLHGLQETTGAQAAWDGVVKALRQGDLIPMLGTAVADAYPDVALFQLYAGWSVIVHIYPAEFTPDPWLLGCEYLAAFFRLAGDDWQRIVNEAGATDWLTSQLPVRLLGLWGRSAHVFDDNELKRLHTAIGSMPLDPFAVGSISARVSDRLEESQKAVEQGSDLRWNCAKTLLALGGWSQALEIVVRQPVLHPEDELLMCQLLFRNGEFAQAFERVYRLLQVYPVSNAFCLLFQSASYLAVTEGLLEKNILIAQCLPDEPDCLASAVNLARCWRSPSFSKAVRQRLDVCATPTIADWKALI
ncbi:hypothetical protein [Trichlorobacter lovleyi]|uniref:Uncharacterized protein n=1 Tax=Trichlorobacter lovleyi (strain ATCC BAA-1151 / DSM 17278 / SZ) TaxID=398767 RepID=B3EBQ4_TRIL1|nr:hypothetical protein [Trichlorobacter lovleyi]ACD97093.1 hypothetical protein Glov_3387 [Trichlorobacter lovleyi SZ]